MKNPIFDILWTDPISGRSMTPVVESYTPSGVPLVGAFQIEGGRTGYPIVDCVGRFSRESVVRYRAWLDRFQLSPPKFPAGQGQLEDSVASFGFQWGWNANMRS